MGSERNDNPFTLDFGREPAEVIPRAGAMEELVCAFTAESPSQHITLISGIRGCGKTVFMTEANKRIGARKDWITVELSPEQDMLSALVAKLGSEKILSRMIQRTQINLSFFGLGVKVEGNTPITNSEIALDRMLADLKKHRKRVLICIDEAVNNQNMRIFASTFQILLRKEHPVFLIMTGLYDNIRALQNQKTLTFLYRAPRINLQPLNIGSMADSYQRIFELDREAAVQMARETRGYSFAFQVLGYFRYKYPQDKERIRQMYKQYLEECVYEKVWAECSAMDRKVASAIAQTPDGKISKIREILKMDTNQFNPYRARLIRKGIVDGGIYGELHFTLPLFENFILENENMSFPEE